MLSTATPVALPATDPTADLAALTALTDLVRRLWDRSPAASPDGRETIVCELIEVDLVLERLRLRARTEAFDELDAIELRACAERLGRLADHWNADRRPR